ncbi:MAG: RNA polymerase sigma factor SigM [Micrococcales bacterium]|nr:MAG: RNA polymerase sigma factor SigM [Micrococcales bacterium]PIE27016.1 MAG: RNA polymerase sigma factor SigM [Micrococcales bacterium]
MPPVLHPAEPSEDAGGRSDSALLRAHIAGDGTAFEHLLRRHQSRLWSVALRTARDEDLATEGMQQAIINAYRKAATFQGKSSVGTWLHRVTVNATLDVLRRQRPAEELSEDVLPPTTETTDPAFDQVDSRLVLVEALGRLPPAQRVALVLVDIEGLSMAEAAESLRVPVGTLKARCSRGRAALARILVTDQPGDATVHDARSSNRESPQATPVRDQHAPTARSGGES